MVRGKVALPCDITPPAQDDTVALILWYKDDALTPIFTLDSRKGLLDQARTLTASALDGQFLCICPCLCRFLLLTPASAPLAGRAYFNVHNRPAFLHVDPIRLSDAGDYRCRVDFKKARTVNTVISLKVIGESFASLACDGTDWRAVPPDEPVITDEEGNELKGLVGPYNEGESLRLLCSATGGE